MKEKSLKMNVPKLDDLFTTQEERDFLKATKVEDIDINLIDDFPNHPFKVYNDEKMEEMVESIKENGVMIPAIIRKKEDGRYEMVSGHRRKLACSLAKLEKMPCIVKDLSDDDATILMVDTNIQQRDLILPSERAFAYKMILDAIKKQGQRNDLTCTHNEYKLDKKKSIEILADELGENRNKIQRYIRLTYLIPELLDLVDNQVLNSEEKQKMALLPAIEISYLTEDEQYWLYDVIGALSATPSHSQARILRAKSESKELNYDVISDILSEEKPNQKEHLNFGINKLKAYFPKHFTISKMEKVIIKLLEDYKTRWQSKNKEDER